MIHPPQMNKSSLSLQPPHLLVRLIKGSYFAIIPSIESVVPEWHAGNIYDMDATLPQPLTLPTAPSTIAPTKYHLFVSGDYEVHTFYISF
jgi:hypothetical protein